MLPGTRRYQVGSDGGFWIADAVRNGKYKAKGTLDVDLRAYGAGVRALDPCRAKQLLSLL